MPMKLSVSMRVAEDMSDKRKAAMSLEDMARLRAVRSRRWKREVL